MNVNLLITENSFVGTMGKSPVPSKPDEISEGAKFSLTPDDKHPQINGLEKPTADNIDEEIQNQKEPVNKSPQDFTQSTQKQTKSENPSEAENKTKRKEQNEASGTTKQPSEQQNLIKIWLAEHSVAAEQSKEAGATKIEPKVGKQIAQIITNTQTGKSPPVTGNAVKSAEIKLLHSTEKGQSGLKTVLPTTSEGQNGLKAVLPDTSKVTPTDKKQPETGNNTDKVSVLAKTIAETKSVTEKGSTKELVPEIPANTGKSTITAHGKTAVENINLTTVKAKASETQPQSAGINTENQSAQKLNMAAVQVSTGQAKDQGTSTSNKNASQGFEQMLSHNTSQTIITEQTPAATKNATIANMQGQNSFSNVSADIGKQILESIHRSISQQGTDRQITVRLNPPELGKVSITFRQQDAELTGLMEVNKAQTRFEIEQTLPQIIRNLADSGIQIKRLEVMLSNEEQSGQGTLGNQSLQSGGAQQQNSANHGMPGYNPDVDESNEWLASNNSYENLYEFQEGFITDGSINMLI